MTKNNNFTKKKKNKKTLNYENKNIFKPSFYICLGL